MVRSCGTLTAAICVSLCFPSWQSAAAQDVVPSWYPAEPGDTWVYQREDRDGGSRGILNPDTARWKTEETIASSATIAEGRLVLKRVKVLGSLSASVPKYLSDRVPEESIDSHYLVRQNCVYVLDGDDASVESVAGRHSAQTTICSRSSATLCFAVKYTLTCAFH
jgi:hypothetical protein